MPENGEKTTIGLIGKKASLHAQHTFFLHFCAVVLHNYNVKLSETSWLYVLWRKYCTCSCSLFFSPLLILNSFFHRCYKISCFPQEKMSPLFFLSCSSSLSLWDSLACSATFSFSISKFVDMTILITLSLIL